MRRFLLLASLLLTLAAAVPARPTAPVRLPAIVFVSRHAASDPDQIPGFGPGGRALAPGGRLLVRRADGTIRPLTTEARFHDVAHPSVSWDGRRIVFAATAAPSAPWRLWVVDADGRNLRAVTREEVEPADVADATRERVDDLQPCWLPDGRIVFASTRLPLLDQRTGGAVTNLFVVREDGTGLARITSERNGAEAPSIDPRTGRVVYARWWTNRWLPSDRDVNGITADAARSLVPDTVSLWHAIRIAPDGDAPMLAGGRPDDRHQQVAYQPLLLADGALVRVVAEHASLAPAPGGTRLAISRGEAGALRFLTPAGRLACAPAALPDGRVLCSLAGPGGDFGVWVIGRDGHTSRVVDLPGTLELDAAALAPRARPPVLAAIRTDPMPMLPARTRADLAEETRSFRFDCMNVFANGPVDGPFVAAPRVEPGLRIRFFTTLARPEAAGGDTALLVLEAPVTPRGGVHVDAIPADVPMFEQLVDAHGHVVSTGAGPAHGTGSNANRAGVGTRCVGCHMGHSLLPVPINGDASSWVDVAPSANVEVSGGEVSPSTLVDRRARGQVPWTAPAGARGEVRLTWKDPMEVREIVLFGGATPGRCEVVLEREGRMQATLDVARIGPGATRVACARSVVDAIRIRSTGDRRALALTEIEVSGRLAAGTQLVLR